MVVIYRILNDKFIFQINFSATVSKNYLYFKDLKFVNLFNIRAIYDILFLTIDSRTKLNG